MRLYRVFLLSVLALAGCSRSSAPIDGAVVFKTCAACHQVGPDARGGFGPQLNGLFGRRAGTTPDYAYSDAMRHAGIVWNEQTLRAYLRDPDKVVPGNHMQFWGISDERELSALLGYLKQYQDVR